MRRRITVVSARALPYAQATALRAVWNIQNIERTEVKADAVTVTRATETLGSYRVRGHFAGVPWRGEFSYELKPDGFHSRNAPQPGKGSTIEGGFVVHAVDDGTSHVVHYEQYRLPWWLAGLASPIKGYLRWSMRRELRDLEQLIAATPADASAVS